MCLNAMSKEQSSVPPVLQKSKRVGWRLTEASAKGGRCRKESREIRNVKEREEKERTEK